MMCQRCFTTYVWVKPLKDKKSNHKANKLWGDQGRGVYNKPMQ